MLQGSIGIVEGIEQYPKYKFTQWKSLGFGEEQWEMRNQCSLAGIGGPWEGGRFQYWSVDAGFDHVVDDSALARRRSRWLRPSAQQAS